jgi:hypothetical protein
MKTSRLPCRPGRAVLAIILACCLAGLVGCADQKGAVELAKLGADTAKTLGDFYDSLVQTTLDYWELLTFDYALHGRALEQKDKDLYQARIQAMNQRARLARSLADTYGALSRLASYDASGEVKNAASGLSQAVMKLPQMPATAIDPSTLFGMLAGELAGWVQTRNLRRGSELLLQTVEDIQRLFAMEQEAYNNIIRELGEYQKGTIKYLISQQLIAAWPLLKIPASLGLNWVNEKRPVEDVKNQIALREIAYFRVDRLTLLSAETGDNLKGALQKLAENHRQFLARRPLNLDQTLAALQKAQAYLDEIARIKTAKSAQGGTQ